MRLSPESIGRASGDILLPSYDRTVQGVGIVHFGIGAFHRAHQAWYTHACLDAGERGWMIAGVSMRSPAVAAQLNPQGGLYTHVRRTGSRTGRQVIGAVKEVLLADRQRAAVVDRIAAPDCQIVSFTVTEKGYCRELSGDLDLQAAVGGFYPLVTEGLRRRRDAGLPGVTLLSCDNLADNGAVLGKLLAQWLAAETSDLADWFAATCRTPNTMVDRIVPASTEADLDDLEKAIGLRDEGAVFTEPFSQWVIEDDFAGARPAWERHGAQIVSDVAPYETAKLRMLNGAHSLLAYCGLRAGYAFVHEATGDANLRRLALDLMQHEAAPTIVPGKGQDLRAYAEALVSRFENTALNHRLSQIAMDGSQKIPQRWLETLAAQQRAGRQCPAILEGIAAWTAHLRGANGAVDDPWASELSVAAASAEPVIALFGANGLLASQWTPASADLGAIAGHLA